MEEDNNNNKKNNNNVNKKNKKAAKSQKEEVEDEEDTIDWVGPNVPEYGYMGDSIKKNKNFFTLAPEEEELCKEMENEALKEVGHLSRKELKDRLKEAEDELYVAHEHLENSRNNDNVNFFVISYFFIKKTKVYLTEQTLKQKQKIARRKTLRKGKDLPLTLKKRIKKRRN